VGLPASGVRAAIMGSILLLAQILGRQNASSRTIVLAGSLMLLQNPLLLLYDVGFQLSFLASMGIIHLKPLLDSGLTYIKESFLSLTAVKNIVIMAGRESRLKSFLQRGWIELRDIFSITLSAQIFTLPVIIYNFETISLIAPLTNLLISPIIPFLMSFGFLAALFGIFSEFLGWAFSLPCYLLLLYFLKVLYIFNKPWAVKIIENVSWVWLPVYYFVVSISIFYLKKAQKLKFLEY
jgi:competence protein ComEC